MVGVPYDQDFVPISESYFSQQTRPLQNSCSPSSPTDSQCPLNSVDLTHTLRTDYVQEAVKAVPDCQSLGYWEPDPVNDMSTDKLPQNPKENEALPNSNACASMSHDAEGPNQPNATAQDPLQNDKSNKQNPFRFVHTHTSFGTSTS